MRPVARVNEKSIRSLDRRAIATCTYPAHKMEAAARVELRAAGSATVPCATHDLGTGAYTALTQISFEQLGVPFEKITFELGSSKSPLSVFLSINGRECSGAAAKLHQIDHPFRRFRSSVCVERQADLTELLNYY